MIRLLDRISEHTLKLAASDSIYVTPRDEKAIIKHFVQQLRSPDVVPIIADNVMEYYFAGTDQEYWDYREHFPNMAPPFERFWIEMSKPSKLNSEKYGEFPTEGFPNRLGWYFEAYGGGPWDVITMPVVEVEKGHIVGPLLQAWFKVDKEGLIAAQPKLSHVPQRIIDPMDQVWLNSLASLAKPAWLAVCFMHCRNVEKVKEGAAAEKLNKAHKKRYGAPLHRFYTLKIGVMQRILEKEGRANEIGVPMALHVCRGHFKEFTEDKPLFGKHVGRYWWPMHVRGKADAGSVDKQYKVEAQK